MRPQKTVIDGRLQEKWIDGNQNRVEKGKGI